MNKNTIEKNRKMCHKILKAMDVLEQIYNYEPLDEIELIYKLYITEEGATNTAIYLNSIGKRIKTERGSRAYTSTDVLKIIRDTENHELVNPLILNLAKEMSGKKSRYKKWMTRVIDLCS